MPGFPAPFIQFVQYDDNGDPLAGGKLASFAAGTDTPLATYTTQALNVENLNPTILNAAGRASVYIEDGVGYKFILYDALDNELWSEDHVQVPEIQAPAPPAELPVGGIIMWPALVAPPGYLLCDGTTYTTADPYDALFLVIGHTWGGSGGNFSVPDMRQRFPLGKAAAGTGTAFGNVSGVGGAIDHTHTGPSHTHPIAAHTHSISSHTHSVPRDGWGNEANTPAIGGRLQTGDAGGTGPGASASQATINNVTGSSSVADTGANTTGIVTDAGGTAVTGTANPPFLVLNFAIRYL